MPEHHDTHKIKSKVDARKLTQMLSN